MWPKGTFSTHLTYWQTKCCNNQLLLVIKRENVAKYCNAMYGKFQTIICIDKNVMKLQSL